MLNREISFPTQLRSFDLARRWILVVGVLGGIASCKSTSASGQDSAVLLDAGDALPDLLTCRNSGPPTSIGCNSWSAGGSVGKLPSPALNEVSGLVVSRKNPGIVWMHNDSGDTARVFAISVATPGSPQLVATYKLTGVTADDWEDIAIGPASGRSGDFLYLGDIGNNFNRVPQRNSLQVYRIPEPTVDSSKTGQLFDIAGAERIDLQYPDGKNYDCEALLVDPQTAELLFITKNLFSGPSYVFRAPAVATPGAAITLQGITDCSGSLRPLTFPERELPAITGADVSAQGTAIIVRAYSGVFLWNRAPGESIADSLSHEPCKLPMASEPQGEAVGFTPDGARYFTVSEGAAADIHVFDKK